MRIELVMDRCEAVIDGRDRVRVRSLERIPDPILIIGPGTARTAEPP